MTGYVLEVGTDHPTTGRTCVGEVGPFSSPMVAEAWFAMHRGMAVRDLFDLPLTYEWSEAGDLQDEPIKGWTLVYDDGETSTLVKESTT